MEIVSLDLHPRLFKSLTINSSNSYRRTYMPASYHIAQEIQKYNIPDYRPRQTQYVISSLSDLSKRLILTFVDFKMPLKRFAPSNGCDEIVALRLARRRTLRVRTNRALSVLMIHLKHTHDRQVTDTEDCCLFCRLIPMDRLDLCTLRHFTTS